MPLSNGGGNDVLSTIEIGLQQRLEDDADSPAREPFGFVINRHDASDMEQAIGLGAQDFELGIEQLQWGAVFLSKPAIEHDLAANREVLTQVWLVVEDHLEDA